MRDGKIRCTIGGDMAIRKTTIAIDDELVEEAREVLGTRSIRETVHASLQAVLALEARLAEIRALEAMEGLDLDDPAVMRGAWRP